MSNQNEKENHSDPESDNSFWNSLFQSEETSVGNTGTEAIPGQRANEDSPTNDRPLSNEKPKPLPAGDVPQQADGDPWELAKTYYRDDKKIRTRVAGYNKGGLLVMWNGIQGFVPASQLVELPQFHIPRERVRALVDWLGKEIDLIIIEVDPTKNRLIFSERTALVPAEKRETLLNRVEPGEKRNGVVTNLTEFGAFVDLGGVEGLIHISEISWSRVAHPSMVLRPGQQVEVIVLSVNPGSERVALSMKRLRPDPWLTAEEKYKPGQIVRGVISHITTFGAFVVLEAELEGLVHISELAEGVFLHPRDVVRTGDVVVARVLEVNSHQKRIALTMRNIGDKPDSRS